MFNRCNLSLLMAVAVGLGGMVAPLAAGADDLLIQRVQQERGMHLPARGMSMAQVERDYGAPRRRLQPRGGDTRLHPVINRWEYADFIVYFQGNHVIHSVLNTPAGNNTHPATAN